MGFQFIREECYAQVRSQAAPSNKKGKKRYGPGKLAAREVIAEAIRAEGAAPHVSAPIAPKLLWGIPAAGLLAWLTHIENLAREIKVVTSRGKRKQRSDTPILMGVIASFPQKADDSNPLYVSWKIKTLEFFKSRYGSALISVLEHTDEEFGHLHAQVADNGKNVKHLHAGHSEALKAARRGEGKKEQSDAYKKGMRQLQDDFFKAVSIYCGLARVGPRKRRKSRAEWQAEKQQNLSSAYRIAEEKKTIIEASIAKSQAESLLQSSEINLQNLEKERRLLVAERLKIVEERKEIDKQSLLNRHNEQVLGAALGNVDITNLQQENSRLRQRINLLSGQAMEVSHNPIDSVKPGSAQVIFRKR